MQLLKSGPKPAIEVLKSLGLLDASQIDLSNLWREEVIGKSGFTPTDILHVDGRHTPWDQEASRATLTVFSNYLSWEIDRFQKVFWNLIAEKITKTVLHLENTGKDTCA